MKEQQTGVIDVKGLSKEQLKFFEENGYVIVKNVVPKELIDATRKRVNGHLHARLSENSWSKDYNWPEVGKLNETFELVTNKCTMAMCESLLGKDNVSLPPQGCVKLVWPRLGSPPSDSMPLNYWHIDGAGNVALAKNGYNVSQNIRSSSRVGGSIGNFSLLAGIVLHDVSPPFVGSFTVWPGTHRICAKLLREHGIDWFLQNRPNFTDPPIELEVSKGDLILAHPLLPHAAAWNYSPDIRYAVYFRLRHSLHQKLRDRMLSKDEWIEFPHINRNKIEESEERVENFGINEEDDLLTSDQLNDLAEYVRNGATF